MSIPKAVITGGPGAGKTTILKALPDRYGNQILTMPEVASILLEGGFPKPGVQVEYNDRWAKNFQSSVISVQESMEEEFMEMSKKGPYRLVVLDRGLLDGSAYLGKGLNFYLEQFRLDEQSLYDRYDLVIHLESLAVSDPGLYEKIKSSNPARYETAEEASWRDQTIKEAWQGHPNRVIIESVGGIEMVKQKVITLLDQYLNTEIERKFLLKSMPVVALPKGVNIRQGYLDLNTEIRVREIDDQHYITIKSDGDISRQECEAPINAQAFEQIWTHETNGRKVEKIRYFIDYGEETLELDQYLGLLNGLVTLECEFRSKEEAEQFTLPYWAEDAIEVTYDPKYKNRNLAFYGLA